MEQKMEFIKYIYFNTEINTFVFTNKKKSSKKYLLFPIEQLQSIAKRNILSVKHYIIKSELSTSFLYFSVNELKKLEIPENYEQDKSIYTQPNGIWLSHGISWLENIERYEFPNKYNLFSYTYKVDLFNTIKIISDKESLFTFIKKYKKKQDDIRMYDIIDWDKVKEEFTGLIITPHLGRKIWRDNYESFYISGQESVQDFFTDLLGPKWKNNILLLSEWYRGWPRCAGGVIWNIEAISSFTLVKKTNYLKYLN